MELAWVLHEGGAQEEPGGHQKDPRLRGPGTHAKGAHVGKDLLGLHLIHPPIPYHMRPTRRQQASPHHTGGHKGTSLPHIHHHPPLSHRPLFRCQLLRPFPAWSGRLHHMPMRTHPPHVTGPRTLMCLPHQGACDFQVPMLHPLPPHPHGGPVLPPHHTPVQGTHYKAMCLPP
jgi:hypothetical protein